jgi:hypothetical protein
MDEHNLTSKMERYKIAEAAIVSKRARDLGIY